MSEDYTQQASYDATFEVGDRVRMVGLLAAAKYNGVTGKVRSCGIFPGSSLCQTGQLFHEESLADACVLVDRLPAWMEQIGTS